MHRNKSKARWTIPCRNLLLPRKFCSVLSHAFGSKSSCHQQGFSSSESTDMESMSRELHASDHGGDSSSFSEDGRGRAAFKIVRMRCSKWRRKKRNADSEENAKRSNQLASRFSALLGLGPKKDSEFGFKTWKISPVNKVGSSEDSFAGEIPSPDLFNRKTGLSIDEKEGELELCKKRILMGERCRPLNSSGSLHYDHNGVLLPEFLPNE